MAAAPRRSGETLIDPSATGTPLRHADEPGGVLHERGSNPSTRIPRDSRRDGDRGWQPPSDGSRRGHGRPTAEHWPDTAGWGPLGRKTSSHGSPLTPRDASNLVIVGSRDLSEATTPDRFHMEPVAWFSLDKGASWSPGEFAGTADLPRGPAFFADANATFAPDGTAFCVFMGRPRGNRSDLWVFRSGDGGRRWLGPTIVPGFLDYPRLAADLDGGKPRLFVVANGPGNGSWFGNSKRSGYGCVVLRSDDGGRTFSAVNLLAPTALLHTPIESPSILPNGSLLIGFVDFPDMPAEKRPQAQITHGRYYTASSRDGGATFSLPAPIRDTRLHEGYGDGFVAITVDRTDGPRKGRLYALTDNRSDDPPGLQLQTSQDAVNWTPPGAVPGLRAGPTPYAAIALSSQGVLGLSWIQGNSGDLVRFHEKAWTSKEHAWDLYFTASTDGGTTFSAPLRVLPTPSRTDVQFPNWPYRTDYLSLAASADGAFHLLWIDTRDSKGEIHATRIEVVP